MKAGASSPVGWLSRRGLRQRMRVANVLSFAPALALVLWFGVESASRGQEHRQWDTFLTFVVLSSIPLGAVASLLRTFVRCRVCGLRLTSCTEARAAGSRKWQWLESLDSCPVCGDDGSASAESRERWRQSGLSPEPPYWNASRTTVALLVMLAIAGGGIWYGVSYRPNPATWAKDRIRGVVAK
jgi:hypothetical protein